MLRKSKLLVMPMLYLGGVRNTGVDLPHQILSFDVGFDNLGKCIQHYLNQSVEKRHDAALWDPENGNKLGKIFGLKDKRSLYPGMKLVWVDRIDGIVTFQATRAGRGGSFEVFGDQWKNKADVVISSRSSDVEFGQAARLALSRSV